MLCIEADMKVKKEEESFAAIFMGSILITMCREESMGTPEPKKQGGAVILFDLKRGQDRILRWCEMSKATDKAYWYYVQMRDMQVLRALQDAGASDAWIPYFLETILHAWNLDTAATNAFEKPSAPSVESNEEEEESEEEEDPKIEEEDDEDDD